MNKEQEAQRVTRSLKETFSPPLRIYYGFDQEGRGHSKAKHLETVLSEPAVSDLVEQPTESKPLEAPRDLAGRPRSTVRVGPRQYMDRVTGLLLRYS
ncbi:hypothetical protein HYS92_03120 [Candidatus Daviesbacteria bacterium]|nr:hypothetical protein [Candidatus Daviesbacteria bacterium]